MKYLIRYAYRSNLDGCLHIRDTVQTVERLDEFAVNSIRENLRKQTGHSVSIIAINEHA
jgi:hypothetical protein